MQVESSGQMQQTHMRKMDGSGGGMKEMMQSMSPEDRTAFREQMSSMSEADRKTMKNQMAQMDTSNLSSSDLFQQLQEMLLEFQNTASKNNELLSTTIIDTYA
ncbi:MAG: hypothetical protein QG558_568 [Campylobacterota bacterium]|nr:hypothetical protein [Campylobacterota bacterium]